MGLDSIFTSGLLTHIRGPAGSSSVPASPGESAVKSVEISAAGTYLNLVSVLSGRARDEAEAFHEKMRNAVRSGTYDPATLAGEAPGGLKALAEDMGVDLSGILSRLCSGVAPQTAGGEGKPPGRQAALYTSSGKMDTGRGQTIQSLVERLQGAFRKKRSS